MRSRALLPLAALAVAGCASAGTERPTPAAAEPERRGPEAFQKTIRELEKREGLVSLYVDRERGRIWLEVPPAAGDDGRVGEYLYVEGLVTGLGSNPVGLDRGRLGPARLVVLRRLGERLLIEQPNLRYRAISEDADELRAARQSFATSVIWAGEIAATAADGRSLVDITKFVARDAHGVVERLRRSEQGTFKLDPERSAVDLDASHAFPDNLVFEALLTFAAEQPGPEVRATAPAGDAFSLVQHQALVRLPAEGYRPRRFDPRAGSFAIEFQDYAAPLDEPLERRWIVRHRFASAGKGEPEPIVYYVDRGIPEPVRSAVLEGASWWAKAFEAAGFPGAFRVELMPAGAHPLDVRYNVIQWVHRATRGWSYGGGVVDPRTGERIKGHVSLGSLRLRQDRLLFEGLVGADRTGSGSPDDPIQLSLARIRQLAAHEVGHTLGLAHNFAASTYGRASVMDYPAPLVEVDEGGELDLSRAYAVGVGEWDIHAIRYAYAELPPEEEQEGLEKLVRESIERGLLFLTDPDARPPGAAHPLAALWDNGADPVEGLPREMEVRRIALERFGEDRVARGQPLALLEEVLAVVYFRHRYQLEAALKTIGGRDYRFAVRGDGQPPLRALSGERQRRALATVLATLEPSVLDLPDGVLALLAPRPFGYGPHRELVTGRTAPIFDPLAAAGTAADLAITGLLQPQRAARLVEQHRRDPDLPGLNEVLHGLLVSLFGPAEGETPRRSEIRREIQAVAVRRMLTLAATPAAAPAVRSRLEGALERLSAELRKEVGLDPAEASHRRHLAREIERFLSRPAPAEGIAPAARPAPPGDPIGLPAAARLEGCSFDWTGMEGVDR